MPLPAGISIARNAKIGPHMFSEVFQGFESTPSIRRIFGKETGAVLGKLVVCVSRKDWYMWVDDKMGRVMIGSRYLKGGKTDHIFLDVVHELVHIRQLRSGADLWDKRYSYVDRPTEIEAYRAAMLEAKRLGMPRQEMRKYLEVEWVNSEESERLFRHIGLRR